MLPTFTEPESMDPGNQKVDVGVAPLTITPNNPPMDFEIPILAPLCCADLEILVFREEFFCQGTKKWLFSGDDESNSWTFWAPQLLIQHEEKYLLAGVVDPDCQEDIGLLLHKGSKESKAYYLWSLLVLSWLMVKLNSQTKTGQVRTQIFLE